MIVRGKVTLEIMIGSSEDCNTAKLSLLPDERGLPPGVSSSIECVDGKLVYEVTYSIDVSRLLSVYNTIDDFIRNLRVIMNSLSKI